MLNTYINSLGKNLALNLFVHKSAHCKLGGTVDSSLFALVTSVGHSFLNSAHSLAVCSITFLVDWHVSGQRSNSMFSKRPREHIAGAFPLSHCVGHFDELLEFGGASQKCSLNTFYLFLKKENGKERERGRNTDVQEKH